MVSEIAVKGVQEKWGDREVGIPSGESPGDILCNLCFADDILLVGATRAQIRHMLGDLSTRAGEAGLKLHAGKTKIVSNVVNRGGVLAQSHVQVGPDNIEVLPVGGSVSYLGRKVCFQDFHDVEIQSRIAKGWGGFWHV